MLQGSYNGNLVAISYLVAFAASYLALDMAGRAARGSAASRWRWRLGGGCAMGFGIWSMHFIGMLAFSLPIPLDYDGPKTAGSLLIACIASGFALWLATQRDLPPLRYALGSVLMGGGIAAMHYLGMAALEMRPGIVWDRAWLALSVLVAIAAAGAALRTAFRLREETASAWRMRAVAALVMAAAVVGMHYTGMAAAGFPEGSLCSAAGPDGLRAEWLAAVVTVVAVAILALALAIAVLDRRMEKRTSRLALSLGKANEQLVFLALHDNLTQLPNRVLLEDRIEEAIRRSARSRAGFALMFIDLDGFKAVNDMYGHTMGDRLLHAAAARVVASLRAHDTVARIGGDEFVVLMDLDESSDAAATAQRLIRALGADFDLDGTPVRISGSIGIAVHPQDGAHPRELLTNADAAMYYAKQHGRNHYRFFDPTMNEGAREQLALMQDLRQAMQRGELALHYQPKYGAADGRVIGAEALLRWRHPVRGTLSPERFIALAEKTGLLYAMDTWTLDEACRQLRAWHDAGLALPGISINLSPVQFESAELFERVRDTLARHRLEPDLLTLEVTESTAMRDPEQSLATLQRLSDLGVHISIDDFGTGYSSLLYLKRLPARELKIDRGFVSNLMPGTEDAAIVSAIVALGRTLELTVLAEGVETRDQADLLTDMGCHSLQGYLLSRPLPPEDFAVQVGRQPAR
ncbi:bifunctional diguanylate cyclase/phosphodiesterase [Lysobacter enzymogenes]|uniref:cyclic-guanylate-specific phosphodiesterase n=1 Tax=Lysobacter enzymogenes TaxID=69 RepID=A0A2D3I2V5_LYSEN|nr:bifunctional diguanylate cyclase/phosphodiesterase [Lysobacter enzymogenes]ROU06403.1 bifunctional diguanylate cyclase/phosphodiesterase [Lysobacter enzymogenes]